MPGRGKTARGVWPQAAAVPWRGAGAGLEILLITSRDPSPRWIIPQGGVEPGQTDQEAAVAEAWEEAGVRGAISPEAFAGYEYEIGAGRCAVRVFHLEATIVEEDWPERHERKRRWLPYEDALEAISGETLKSVLRAFARERSREKP